jgi:hypothetical protein
LIRYKKATGNDNVPGNILRFLGVYGFKIMTQLIKNIYKTAEWPRDSIDNGVVG